MKHTIVTLTQEINKLHKVREEYRKDIEEMKAQIDQMKDAMDQFLLTTNSAYKKKKALEDVGDFLGKRFGR